MTAARWICTSSGCAKSWAGRTRSAPYSVWAMCWSAGNERRFAYPFYIRQHRTIPALRLKHRSGSCGTASALPKCSIMSGCGTRIVLRGQKPLALCDRCPCFGSLFPPLAALTFAASSIICAFGLASAAPRSPYRHLELCGIALKQEFCHEVCPQADPCPAGGAGSCAFAVQHGADRAAVPAGAAHRAGNVICRLAAGKPRHAAHLGHTRQRQPGRTGGQLFAGHHRAEQPCLRRLQCGWNLPVLCPAHRGSLIRSGSPACPGWRAAHGAGEQPYPAVRRNGRSAGTLHHLGHCAGCRPRVAGAAGPHPKCTDRRTFWPWCWPGAWFCCSAAA